MMVPVLQVRMMRTIPALARRAPDHLAEQMRAGNL